MNTRQVVLFAIVAILAIIVIATRFLGGTDPHDLADSDDPARRIEAAYHAGRQGEVQLLEQLARDPEPAVAHEAVAALAEYPDRPAHQKMLTDLAQSLENPEVRGKALAALGHVPDADLTMLTDHLDPEHPAPVRAGAMQGLARLAEADRTETAPHILRGLRDDHPAVRAWASEGVYYLLRQRYPQYDAGKSPDTQRKIINAIEQAMRNHGLL